MSTLFGLSGTATAADPFGTDPIAVEVVRNGFVESVHHARVVITDPAGEVLASVGAEFAPIYPRSAAKPLQAVGMVRAGLDLTDPADARLLAVVCASHSGEEFHLDAVTEILRRSGLDASALQTPASLPTDEDSRVSWIRAGRPAEPLAYNCSGKHAGMLRTAATADQPIATYRDPEHPVQRAILAALDDLSGERASALAMDGCGAPLYAISTAGLARAFGRIAAAGAAEIQPGHPRWAEAAVARAITACPRYVSGTARDEFALLRSLAEAGVPVVGKAGAEAVYAVGLPDGRGVALKVGDGGERARSAVMAGVLHLLGLDTPVLDQQASAPVMGHGERVGEIRPAASLLDALARQLG